MRVRVCACVCVCIVYVCVCVLVCAGCALDVAIHLALDEHQVEKNVKVSRWLTGTMMILRETEES